MRSILNLRDTVSTFKYDLFLADTFPSCSFHIFFSYSFIYCNLKCFAPDICMKCMLRGVKSKIPNSLNLECVIPSGIQDPRKAPYKLCFSLSSGLYWAVREFWRKSPFTPSLICAYKFHRANRLMTENT